MRKKVIQLKDESGIFNLIKNAEKEIYQFEYVENSKTSISDLIEMSDENMVENLKKLHKRRPNSIVQTIGSQPILFIKY